MLEIKNLKASVEGKEVLKGINLKVNAGEVHAIHHVHFCDRGVGEALVDVRQGVGSGSRIRQ